MNMYKVVFAKNEPISLHLVSADVSSDNYCYYEHDKGHLIFAMIRAEHEQEATDLAREMARNVATKVFGGDSIL